MKSLRVLVLGQESEERDRLVALLRAADHRVHTLPDSTSADSATEPGIDTLVIDMDAPGLDLTALRQAISAPSSTEPESLEAAERRHVAHVLRYTAGNKRRAAHLLGISRSTLLNKVRKYGIEER